jgi:tetratricopeptide (TPR) repeat protein
MSRSPGPADRRGARRLPAVVLLVLALLPGGALAQSLEERLDEEAFLRGLVEQELSALLEHYETMHPPDDPVRSARFRIATERLNMRRARDDAARRLAALDRLLAVRAELIALDETDSRRAVWLADQAGDLLFELLPTDASGVSALFGLPTPAQRARAQRVAREMEAATALAEIEIEAAILEVEGQPGFRESARLQMHRRRLARDERDRRLPFLRGIALVLHATLVTEDASTRRRELEAALDRLAPIEPDLEPALADRARLYRACALLGLERHDEAEALFERVAGATGDGYPTDRHAARLGVVRTRLARGGPDAALALIDEWARAAADALLFRLLLEDQRFLILRDLALAETGDARRAGMQRAFAGFLDLLDADLGLSPDAMRAVVFARLATVTDDDVPLDDFPPIVSVARAEHLAGEAGRADEAIALFADVLDRPGLRPRERASALFGVGKALHAAGRELEAAHAFTQLAETLPDDPDAPRSIDLAATIGAGLVARAPGDAAARRQYRDTLAVLLAGFADRPGVDRWRFEAGRAALRDGDAAEAGRWFAEVPVDAPEGLDAAFMRVSALRALAAGTTEPGSRARRYEHVHEAAEAAAVTIESGRAGADPGRAADLGYYLAHLRVFRAEAQLAQDEPAEALEILAAFDGRAEGETDPGVLAAMLRTRIAAYQALARPEDARREVERYLEAAPAQAGAVLDSLLAAMVRDAEERLAVTREAEAREQAARDLVPLARLLEQWIATHRPPPDQRTTLEYRVADAYRLGGEFEAGLRLYDLRLLDDPAAVELLAGRAECLFGLGGERYGDAMRIYRRVAAGGRDVVAPDLYWLSQLRMLQILDRTGRNTDRILPRIRRLRLEDPDLGGTRWKRGLERLAIKYG